MKQFIAKEILCIFAWGILCFIASSFFSDFFYKIGTLIIFLYPLWIIFRIVRWAFRVTTY
jgi:uncharacterized membrane protein